MEVTKVSKSKNVEPLLQAKEELVRKIQSDGLSITPAIIEANLIPNAHHAILTVWHPELRDGRAMAFLARESDVAYRQLCRAQLNLEIFSRGTTLNERLLARAERLQREWVNLSIIISNSKKAEMLLWDSSRSVLTVARTLWDELKPDLRFLEALQKQHNELPGVSDLPRLPEAAVDAARPLRATFQKHLLLTRARSLDQVLASKKGQQQLCVAATDLTAKSYSDAHRSRHYSPEILQDLPPIFSIGIDFDLLDLFLCYLQALGCYLPNATGFICYAYSREPSRGVRGSAFVYALSDGESAAALDQAQLQTCYEAITAAIDDHKHTDIKPAKTCFTIPQTDILKLPPTDILKLALDSAIRDTSRDRLKDHRSLLGLSNPDSTQVLILREVMIAAGLLSAKVHEGRGLHFAFALSEGLLWREVEGTLSHESDACISENAEKFANLVNAHWSIFQAERVVGVIDVEQRSRKGRIALSKLVRLKAPPRWSGLPSQVFSHVADVVPGCSIVHATGDSRVLLYHDKCPVLRWDVRTNDIDTMGTVDDVVKNILRIVGLTGTQSVFDRHLEETLKEALQEVSETPGDGALLFILPPKGNGEEGNTFHDVAKSIIRQMDQGEYQMAWRKEKSLYSLDRTLLRAMLVLDGASVINEQRITPRFVVYPHVTGCDKGPHAFSLMDLTRREEPCSCAKALDEILGAEKLKDKLLERIRDLDGKGSKHHGAANASVLLWKTAHNRSVDFRVITISADGPIKEWPDALGLVRREST